MAITNEKIFLDLSGLALYDQLIKEYVDAAKAGEENRAKAAEQELLTALNTLAQSTSTSLGVLNGDKTVEGSIDKKINDAINALVNGAPEALDTLKEIADWIANDENGTGSLLTRVSAVEDKAKDNAEKIGNLKTYVDAQDNAFYNRVNAIQDVSILGLFRTAVTLSEGQTVAAALESLGSTDKLVLGESDSISENLTIPAGVIIEANGATFSGDLTISKDAVIQDAVFTGKVTIN